tara:strand:+ start:1013 stop:1627 length:615 start_codon:yes stop_codon:yes gene_type:complete
MTLNDAYDYIDLMIDKANQPYFINTEKDIFLNLSITEFLNKRYALMRVNQDYSEMIGNRASLNEGSAGYTIVGNYVELIDYYHITNAILNGVTCRIVSDDEMSNLLLSNNPYKSVNADNPICALTKLPTGTLKLYFHDSGPNNSNPDFAASDTFNVRYLRHLTVSQWTEIPEHYQHDILNVVVRKLTANIESTNYTVQANEEQQ